ncbi:carboxymuconolactone decarboxylase family protein [Chloroflexota bacterium]
MARPEEAKAVKAFKDAKTAEEMVRSWASQSPGRDIEPVVQACRYFIDKRPDLIERYAHRGLQEIMDRGTLDRKTRELVFIAILLQMESELGLVAHVANAKAAGATEEEICEVAAIVCYEAGKHTSVISSKIVGNAMQKTANVKIYKP